MSQTLDVGRTSGHPAPSMADYDSPAGEVEVLIPRGCFARYIMGTNGSGSAAWLHIFDSATVVADGQVPDRTPVYVFNDQQGFLDFDGPDQFVNGIYACFSSTQAVLTKIAADDFLFEIR